MKAHRRGISELVSLCRACCSDVKLKKIKQSFFSFPRDPDLLSAVQPSPWASASICMRVKLSIQCKLGELGVILPSMWNDFVLNHDNWLDGVHRRTTLLHSSLSSTVSVVHGLVWWSPEHRHSSNSHPSSSLITVTCTVEMSLLWPFNLAILIPVHMYKRQVDSWLKYAQHREVLDCLRKRRSHSAASNLLWEIILHVSIAEFTAQMLSSGYLNDCFVRWGCSYKIRIFSSGDALSHRELTHSPNGQIF